MQILFHGDTPWHTPWVGRILPQVEALAARVPEQTIFTRFIPPERPQDMPGIWRRYYERWRSVTLEKADPSWVRLIPVLARFVPPALVIDKHVYSPFFQTILQDALQARGADSVVITGTETDVCVLAAALGAIDYGYRVVLAEDALCSSSNETHDALMKFYRERLAEQLEIADTETILAAWR